MKKILTILSLLCISLVACGDKDEDTKPAENQDENQKEIRKIMTILKMPKTLKIRTLNLMPQMARRFWYITVIPATSRALPTSF